MKQLKRTLMLLLAATLLFCSACTPAPGSGGSTAVPVSTAPSDTTTDGNYEPLVLPDLDFDGKTIRILTEHENEYYCVDSEGEEYENYYAGELTTAELNNEPVNDAVYNREIFVEDLLNVEIELIQTQNRETARETVATMFAAGDIGCEIASAPCAATMWSSQFGYYHDLRGVENLNPESPWWSQDFNTESSFGNCLYFVTGDLSLTLYKCSYITLFNTKLAEDNGITDVYQTVFDGKWTIDTLLDLSSRIYVDINGNSEPDEDDTYGFIGACLSGDPLWSAFDIDILSKDADDYIIYTPQLEKFGNAYEKTLRLFSAKTTYNAGWNDDDVYKYFVRDQALFAGSKLVKAETEAMRNMQSEYGILPVPKYDEAQKDYYTMPHDQYTVFGIPATLPADDADISGAVLEAMGWYSYRHVTPAYLDLTVKGKYANDPDTRKLLDIITSGIRIDAAWIYAFYLNDYPQLWRVLIGESNENYTSKLTEYERKIKLLTSALNESYRKLSEG